MTLLTASRKSFSVAIFRRARMANMPASVHTLRISAPVKTRRYQGDDTPLHHRDQAQQLTEHKLTPRLIEQDEVPVRPPVAEK